MIAYFTLLVGEHCSHMMINKTLEHKHHNILLMSSLLIVNALRFGHTGERICNVEQTDKNVQNLVIR